MTHAYDPTEDMLKVQSLQKKWRSDFAGTAIRPDRWEVQQRGSGMSYSVGNGLLTIGTGTALDDELAFLSQEVFTIPVRLMVALNLGQRIAGQTVFVELVSIDPETRQPDEMAVAAWRLDGTTATQAIYEVATGGMPRLMSAASTIPTTASTGFSCLEIECFPEEAWFHGRTMDGAAARAQSYVRHQQIPDPNRPYRVRLRVRNRQQLDAVTAIAAHTDGTVKITRAAHGLTTGDVVTAANVVGLTGVTFPWTGTVTVLDTSNFTLDGTAGFGGAWVNTGWVSFTKEAGPASSTTVNVNFVTVVDYAELTAEITAGRGAANAGQGMAVTVVGSGNGSQQVQGAAARNTNGPGNPLYVATGLSANPSAVTSGRNVDLLATLIGALVVKPYGIPELDWQFAGAAGGITNTTDVAMKAAAGAGVRNYVTGATLINTGAAATEVVLKDGATVIFRLNLPANMTTPVDLVFATPLKGTANTTLNVACLTAGAAVFVSAQGYAAP
jgi:hypothetical protein